MYYLFHLLHVVHYIMLDILQLKYLLDWITGD